MAAAVSYAMAVNIDSRDDETAISCDWAAALSGAVAALGFCWFSHHPPTAVTRYWIISG
jgi:hypothetical protein